MDVLRCKTPELVRKGLRTHILAYNLIRTVMAQAATRHGIEPRSISFKGALQTLEAFQPVIALGRRDSDSFENLSERLLDAVARLRVVQSLLDSWKLSGHCPVCGERRHCEQGSQNKSCCNCSSVQ